MGTVLAILSALSAAYNVFKQERAVYNNPDLVKNKLAMEVQKSQDAINLADEVLANPHSTPKQHADALRTIRLAQS